MESTRSTNVNQDLVRCQFEIVKAQNIRLSEENALLHSKLNHFTVNQRSTFSLNVESKIRAYELEDECDRMYENLERVKKKYNKLHEAYLEKVKRCKALEDTFKRQKTLTGLVTKLAMEQKQIEPNIVMQKRVSELDEKTITQNLEMKVANLKTSLDEAYDIIDELEFELESIDFLEMENQQLQNQLHAIESKSISATAATYDSVCDEEVSPQYCAEEQGDATTKYNKRLLVASSTCESSFKDDDADSETMHRAALTNSLIKIAEAESNCLRRELLRSRLQNTIRRQKENTIE